MRNHNHGGERPGAGRKAGTGAYGEATQSVRVPVSRVGHVTAYLSQYKRKRSSNVEGLRDAHAEPTALSIPFLDSPRPKAGFPSPAGDYVEDALDLNKLLIPNPPATFMAVVSGDSVRDLGVLDKDIVVVDRSLNAAMGDLVLAVADGDLYVKVLEKVGGRLALASRNEARAQEYPPIYLDAVQDYTIWGVVTSAVRRMRRR